jgi:hypothetical protein
MRYGGKPAMSFTFRYPRHLGLHFKKIQEIRRHWVVFPKINLGCGALSLSQAQITPGMKTRR